MKELSKDDKLFFFERNFFTLDGLWMIETEKALNWDKALDIDLLVWKKLLKIVFRRLKKYLKIKNNNLENLIKLLSFRWSAEGWNYKILYKDKNNIDIEILKCPYNEVMNRNPDRHDKIPLICRDICIPLYRFIIKEFNQEIELKRNQFKGIGDRVCNFQISQDSFSFSKSKLKPKSLTNYKINKKGKLFYFEKNFRTLDGLWFIEVENQVDFDTALKLDILVWREFYKIVFRRVMKYLNIQSNSLKDLIRILSFVWNCEGNYHEIINVNETEVIMNIIKCPYIDAMKRNPERYDRIASICKDMCIPYLKPVLEEFNPNIILKRNKFIGMGDKLCDFHFMLKE